MYVCMCVYAASYCFLERDTFFFDSLMNTKWKRAAFVQNRIFSNNYKFLLWLFIHLTHPSWIKVLISLKKRKKEKMQTFE